MLQSSSPQKSETQHKVTYLKDYKVPSYLIDEVDLIFELNETETIVKSNMKIRHNRFSTQSSKNLILNGEELILESIKLDGEKLNSDEYILSNEHLILQNVPDNFTLEIIVKIYPHKNTKLSGLYLSGKTYCTQCEAEGFRRITFFLDQPDVLSRYTTTIFADATLYPYLLSNGNLIDSGQLPDSRHHWAKWEDPFKKPSYLFALVAGNFDVIQDKFTTQSENEVSLNIYVEKGYKDQAQHAMFSIKEAMRWDEKAFGREYDLDVYMIVAISDFNMGAMENKGLNIFNTKYVLAKPETATDDDYIHVLSVVGHEYFHNWSGNRVTCRDWFQLSLKEGLTIFRDQSFTEDVLSRAVMRIRDVHILRESQFPEDAGPLAHPVRPDSYFEINNFYTATVYNKGAEVLRMLQTILGKSTFRKGMDLYFARHDGQAVTIEDYIKTMEDVSGIDLSQFRLWYSQAGTPQVIVQDDFDQTQQLYSLTISQTCPATPGQQQKLPLYIPIRVGLLDQNGNEMALHLNDQPVETEKILHLRDSSQTFQFKNVAERPTASLLRNFSAPVKLIYPNVDLLFLFQHDTDPFNRWEAGQQFFLRTILNLTQDYQAGNALQLPNDAITVIEKILNANDADKFFLAEMLNLPTEKYIGEQMDVIDVDAIHAAREFVILELAQYLENIFLATYKKFHRNAYTKNFDMNEVGKRQFKNRCLFYLMHLPKYAELGMKQLNEAINSNMTDALIALHGLCNIDTNLQAPALQLFYDTWCHDALVIDKWFSMQASSKLPGTLDKVKKLMHHEAFDIKNPNKVYSLIGTFGYRNSINFHEITGESYAFLGQVVAQLDKLNPHMSARMVKPLTTWKRYDANRQKLMRKQLELILEDKKISTDLYELIIKSLS